MEKLGVSSGSLGFMRVAGEGGGSVEVMVLIEEIDMRHLLTS